MLTTVTLLGLGLRCWVGRVGRRAGKQTTLETRAIKLDHGEEQRQPTYMLATVSLFELVVRCWGGINAHANYCHVTGAVG